MLSPWIALVYFSILLGTMLVASGQVAKWTMVQAICIVVSVVANPFLVRYFQATLQNGAIGVSVGAVSSEIAMVSLGFAMAEKGMVGKRFLVTAGQALLAGGAMALVGRALADRPAVGIALALAAYAAVLTAVGGLRLSDFKQVVDLLRAKRGAA
ncbi:MAG: hypothetical protein JST92_22175 [Deltaproteobacteria bacterium]|nr:hypothetical protein [Deltaproteobacteria bacterium]